MRQLSNGTPQIIVQRYQITAPRWPNDISSAADNAIFKNKAQNIKYRFGCVARSAVLLKTNVANILFFNFCEQNFVQHGPITIAIDCNSLPLLIFEEKLPNYAFGPKSAPKVTRFGCVGFSMYACGFSVPGFSCLHTRQDQNELHLKRWFFFVKFDIFCKSIAGPLPSVIQAYT